MKGGVGIVTGVEKIAISKKYDAIPRQVKRENSLPEELIDMADYPSVQIDTIDLDGDGKEEHIVCARANYSEGEIGDGSPQESSIIILFDSNYKKIAVLDNLEDSFWGNSEEMYKEGVITSKELDENRQFLTLDETEYIDINNDGKIEIIINHPIYEGIRINIVGFKNGELQIDNRLKSSELENEDIQTYKKYKQENLDITEYTPYIFLYNNSIYFSEDENVDNAICYGKYETKANEIYLNTEAQDWAFFNSAEASFETVDERDCIKFQNGEKVIYFENIKNVEK